MKEMILNGSLNIVCKNNNYSNEKKAELKYGLEVLYINVTKIIAIVVISLVFGIFKQFLTFFISFAILRTFGFGLHAKNSLNCWLITIPTFTILPYVFYLISIPLTIKITILVLCTISLFMYAPADTLKRPFVNKKRRIIFKIIITLLALIYGFFIIFEVNFFMSNILLLALLVETIATNKLTYIILKEPFNNYKTYNRNII